MLDEKEQDDYFDAVLSNGFGTVRLLLNATVGATAEEVLVQLVVPLLLAHGYHPQAIKNAFPVVEKTLPETIQ